MKLYKLTNENDQTYGGCQWGKNVTHETGGEGELCGPGWTHWYTHPLLAVMLNPIHGKFDLTTAHLWESPDDQVVDKTDHGLKVGCKKGTTARRIPLPEVTLTQKIAFGILCSLPFYRKHNCVTWANNWLSGLDRSRQAAEAAREAREAAEGAEWAAEAAAWAAWAEWAAEGAEWAEWAVAAAKGAAEAAAWAAWAAAEGATTDLIALAKQAMQVKP